ncbi:MAG: hypothetical protein VKQ33_03510 [Candidatus Sericytochromatia bacterium]|nr:hypothetical protein [Candidatus Sericytochromatia bacterium]
MDIQRWGQQPAGLPPVGVAALPPGPSQPAVASWGADRATFLGAVVPAQGSVAPPAVGGLPVLQAPAGPSPGGVSALAPAQRAVLQQLAAALMLMQQQLEVLIATSGRPMPLEGPGVAGPAMGLPLWQGALPVAAAPPPPGPVPPSPAPPPPPPPPPLPLPPGPRQPRDPASSRPGSRQPRGTTPGPEGPRKPRGAPATPARADVFAAARLDRRQPPAVSWYRPHRQNQEPELRLSGNVTSDNFWREVALASMNVGMSPRRMTSVLQEALPLALGRLGVKLDGAAKAQLASTIRRRTAGLPRANPIPPALHPDRTHKYLDDNPAAVGWRDRYGPVFDRYLRAT